MFNSTIIYIYSTILFNYSTIFYTYSTILFNYSTILYIYSTILFNYSTIYIYIQPCYIHVQPCYICIQPFHIYIQPCARSKFLGGGRVGGLRICHPPYHPLDFQGKISNFCHPTLLKLRFKITVTTPLKNGQSQNYVASINSNGLLTL